MASVDVEDAGKSLAKGAAFSVWVSLTFLLCFWTCFFNRRFPGDNVASATSSTSEAPAPEDLASDLTSVFCFKVCNLANGMISQSAGRCQTVV